MAFTLATRTASVPLNLFADGFANYGTALAENALVLVQGNILAGNDGPRINVKECYPLDPQVAGLVRKVWQDESAVWGGHLTAELTLPPEHSAPVPAEEVGAQGVGAREVGQGGLFEVLHQGLADHGAAGAPGGAALLHERRRTRAREGRKSSYDRRQ